jgi:hypothetical protein
MGLVSVLSGVMTKQEGYKDGVEASKNVVSSAMCQPFDVMGEMAEVPPYSSCSLFHNKVHCLLREGASNGSGM